MSGRRSLIPWIVAFKAFKAVALTALGIALLVTRHADPVDVMVRLALALHLPLTSRVFERLLRIVANLSIAKQTALAITAFGYAALLGAEGLSLYLRKSWARWFTIIATASLIPIEVYEIVRKLHALRVLVLLVNIAVVMYLMKQKDAFRR